MVGREKGKVGRVLKVDRDAGRVIVEKINMVKRHAKPGKTNPQGGIIENALVYPWNSGVLEAQQWRMTAAAMGSFSGAVEGP